MDNYDISGNGHFPPHNSPSRTAQNPTWKLHTYMYAHIHTYMHIHIDACTHVYPHTIHAYIQIFMRTYTLLYSHILTYFGIHNMHTKYTCIHTCMCMYACMYVYAYMYICIIYRGNCPTPDISRHMQTSFLRFVGYGIKMWSWIVCIHWRRATHYF